MMWYAVAFVIGILVGLPIGAVMFEQWTLYRLWTES